MYSNVFALCLLLNKKYWRYSHTLYLLHFPSKRQALARAFTCLLSSESRELGVALLLLTDLVVVVTTEEFLWSTEPEWPASPHSPVRKHFLIRSLISFCWDKRSADSIVTADSNFAVVDGVVVNVVVVSPFDTITSFCDKSQYELFRKHNRRISEGDKVTLDCDSFALFVCVFWIVWWAAVGGVAELVVVVVVVVRTVDEVMVLAELEATVSISTKDIVGVAVVSLPLSAVVISKLNSELWFSETVATFFTAGADVENCFCSWKLRNSVRDDCVVSWCEERGLVLRTGSKYTEEEGREGQPARVTGLGVEVTASPK